MLLAKAARMAGFDAASGWPAELCDVSLACLLAEVEACRNGNDADLWLGMIDNAIKSGDLVATRFEKPDDNVGNLIIFSVRNGYHYLTREAVADWMRNTGETPGELARAWLGDLWCENTEGADSARVGAGEPAGDAARQLRANAMESMRGVGREILEHWDDILAVHGPGADAAQVQRFLTTKRDPSEKKPTGKTIHNRLGELRRDGLIP